MMLEPDCKGVAGLQPDIRGSANMEFEGDARDAVHKLIEANPALGTWAAWQLIAARIGS